MKEASRTVFDILLGGCLGAFIGLLISKSKRTLFFRDFILQTGKEYKNEDMADHDVIGYFNMQ